jgi:hypothetical protein
LVIVDRRGSPGIGGQKQRFTRHLLEPMPDRKIPQKMRKFDSGRRSLCTAPA